MEGNLSSRNTMQGDGSFGGFDLQGPILVHHHQQHNSHPRQGSSMVHHESFPLTMGSSRDCDHTVSVAEYNKLDRGKMVSDEDEPSFVEGVADGRNDPSKGKKASMWQRVKWTDTMVRLLITAVSYISEEAAAEHGGSSRRKYTNLQKKGKWKSVSKVMAERGHFVSPQQCEDKFNDLNKRYKRLNEILGRGTSCEVVENPALLDMMDHISEKAKEEHSLRLALRSRDDHDDNDVKRHPHDDNDEVDQEAEFDDHGENCNKTFNFQAENADSDANQVTADGPKTNATLQKQWMNHRNLQLEEQRLHIEVQMLELEKERFKWQRFCRKKDRELEMMKMEIERMKLENERMALELRRKEMGIDNN
ncbi:UNVERIFIED_CONTAM: hypothetical protein Sradi_3485300 [Sesamum radiatum]|uniref:Myb/SANT-like DNA-binding domain-containing protein n=1 Tax=Sesamum radiatum TaxID=300843 RepID=A0AAW2QDM8_SESRA